MKGFLLSALNYMCMNKKYIHNKTSFNIRLNQDDFDLIKKLKENHAINISRAFKIFLTDLNKKIELQK